MSRLTSAALAFLALTGCFHDPFGLMQESVDWKVIDSEHFSYHYQLDDSAEWRHNRFIRMDGTVYDPELADAETTVREALAYYEEWYALLSGVFPSRPPRRINVYAWSNYGQKDLLGNGTSSAFVDFHKMNGDHEAIHQSTTALIPHELVHVFQYSNGLPSAAWIEGTAVALAGMEEVPSPSSLWSTYDFRPTIALPGREGPVHPPYDQLTTDTGIYSGPVDRFAAYLLALETDPAYPMREGETWPGVRPSQLISLADVLPRDTRLMYVASASYVHYLISSRGWAPFLEAYRTAGLGGTLAGTDAASAFERAYGERVTDVEDEWLAWLRTHPEPSWSAPVHLLFERR